MFLDRSTAATTILRLALAAALALPAPAALAQARFDFAGTPTLLPKTVLPQRATLSLDLDPGQDRFGGRVQYALKLTAPRADIVLHAHPDLSLQSATLHTRGQALRLVQQPSALRQSWRLAPANGTRLAAGTYRLDIRYTGQVGNAGVGLYRVEHRVDGRPAVMLATMLEAIDARRVLPGFDEPVFRMPYEVSVSAPAGLEVLSNMPRAASTRQGAQGDRVLHRFQPTPPMQVYLLSVAVGRFDSLSGSAAGVPLRVFTAPGKREQARRAMDATRELVPWLQDYFGRRFALPKLDQVAVPGVRLGAMEDWGLVSYIENALLFDPATMGEHQWTEIFGVMAHELAHQWFGDLVSPAGWNEIWLNEAFATWMAERASEQLHPEWQLPLQRRMALERPMDEDALGTSRPVRGGFVDEDRVDDIFDEITYAKGGAVVGMVEQWVGAERFREGLRRYMAERAFKPATAGDLWYHVGRASGMPVAGMAASWTDQPGVPLVDVQAQCDGGATAVTLRQSRSHLLAPLPAQAWAIPVTLAIGAERHTLMLDSPSRTWRLAGCSDAPLVANAGGVGYYRVRYAAPLQQRLLDHFARLPATDQVTLLGDSMALARAGAQPLAGHLALWRRLPQVDGPQRADLFLVALAQLRELDVALHGLPAQAALRELAQPLFATELQRLGWDPVPGETARTALLRGVLVERLARLGDAGVLAEARQRFARAVAGDASVPGSLRGPLLVAGAAGGGTAEFDALLDALRRAGDQQQRQLLVGALAALPAPQFTQRLLEEAASGRLASDLSEYLLYELGTRPASGAATYDFVLAHWAELKARLNVDQMNRLLPLKGAWATEPAEAQRLREDNQRLVGAGGLAGTQRAAASIAARAQLREREADALPRALLSAEAAR